MKKWQWSWGNSRSSRQTVTLYRRLRLMLAILFLILAVLLTTIPAYNQLRQLQLDAVNLSLASVADSTTRSQALLLRINNIIRSLITDPVVTAYLYNRSIDQKAAENLEAVLVRYAQENTDIVRTVGVYNAYFQEYRTSAGVQPTSELSSPIYNEQFSIRPREYKGTQSALEALTSPYLRLLTFVSLADQTSAPVNNGFIQINVNETMMRNTLIKPNPLAETVIIDSKGLVLSSTNPDSFITDIRYQPFGDKLLVATETTGILKDKVWGDGYIVTFQKQAKSGLTCASIIRTSTLYTSQWTGIVQQSLAILLLLALSCLAAMLILRRSLKPLGSLARRVIAGRNIEAGIANGEEPGMDEFQMLNRALFQGEQAGNIARQKYLLDIFEGQIDQVSAEALAPFTRNLTAAAYLVIKARFDRYETLAQKQSKDLASFRFAIQNVTLELLSASWPCVSVITSKRDISFLLMLEQPLVPENLGETLRESQRHIHSLFPFTFSFAVSQPVEDLDQVAQAGNDCQELFNYRLYYGRETILNADTARASMRTIRYPINAEKRILEGMNVQKADVALAGIRDFIDAVATGYSDRTVTYLSQLLFSIFKQVDNSIELGEADYLYYTQTSLRLAGCETMEDAHSLLRQFCLDLLDSSVKKVQSTSSSRQDRFIEEIRVYLRKEYINPNLTMESTASAFGLSAGYLGKLFKTVTGISFNEALTEMRMEKAAALLLETALPANKISDKVGIANVTYFSTLFKKTFGVSPSQYREKHPGNPQT